MPALLSLFFFPSMSINLTLLEWLIDPHSNPFAKIGFFSGIHPLIKRRKWLPSISLFPHGQKQQPPTMWNLIKSTAQFPLQKIPLMPATCNVASPEIFCLLNMMCPSFHHFFCLFSSQALNLDMQLAWSIAEAQFIFNP